MEDLAQVAESEGITIDEAIDRYAWNQSFAVLVDKIRQSYSDEFAGSAIEAGDGYSAWVGFRDGAPVGALDLLAGFSRPIEIREGRSFTEAELDEATVRAHYALWDRQDLVENVSSYFEIRTGEILVTVELRDSFRASVGDGDEARDRLVSVLPADVRGRVTVEVVDDLPGGTDTVYGGVRLSTCTTGFTVSSGSGRWITTAGHCGPSQVYDGRLTIYFVKEHRGAWGDFQMHSASETKADDFYSSGSTRRDVAARGPLPSVQQRLCLNGKTTGNHCAVVLKVSQCDGSDCRLVVMNTREAADGDSGGPWFWGNTAYGVHHGDCYSYAGVPENDCFSHITYLDEALGPSVALS